MLYELKKYLEPVILALIIMVCLFELIKAKSAAEISQEYQGKYRILWLIMPFVLLVMLIVKLVWF